MNKFDKKETKEKVNHNCTAWGCPLTGSMNIEGGGWFCRFHYKASFKDFGEITLKIKHAMPMIERCHEIQKDPFNTHLHVYMNNRDFDKLANENAWQYRERLLGYVKAYVLKGIDLEVQVKKDKSNDAGVIAKEIIK